MILTAVLTSILTSGLIIGGIYVIIGIIKRRLQQQIKEFVSAPDEKTPSPLANIADSVSAVFAVRLTNQIKTSLMGMSSVDKKNERALQNELTAGLAINTSPILGLLANTIPSLKKRLAKNGDLAALAAHFLADIGNKTAGENNHPKPPEQLVLY